jgi:hypothetical protein
MLERAVKPLLEELDPATRPARRGCPIGLVIMALPAINAAAELADAVHARRNGENTSPPLARHVPCRSGVRAWSRTNQAPAWPLSTSFSLLMAEQLRGGGLSGHPSPAGRAETALAGCNRG